MKIAICTNHYLPQAGGSEFVVKQIAEHILSSGHQVEIITRKSKLRVKSQYPYKIQEYIIGDTPLFNKTLKNSKPDIVLIYSDVFDFFNYLMIEPKKYKMVVAMCGGNWVNSNKSRANVFTRNIHKIDKIICHSKRDFDYQICNNIQVLDKTEVIPNGVNLTEFSSNTLTRSELLPKYIGKSWIINVSNFFPGKGQNNIFDILNRIPDPERFIYIQICSTIEYEVGKMLEYKWMELSKENTKIKSMLFKDIDRTNLIGFLKNSNVFVCSSQKEVAPLVLLEAMACGVPWVAADVGNTRDLAGGKYIATAKDRTGASIFDDRVINLFTRYISEYLINQSDGELGQKQIETELNWDVILPKYDQIFRDLVRA